MAKLFYWMHYPITETWDAWWETRVCIISLNEDTVRSAWNAAVEVQAYEDESTFEEGEVNFLEDNRLSSYDANIDITSDTIWVIYSYSHTKGDSAEFLYAGNSLEDCLAWCKKERGISGLPSFEHRIYWSGSCPMDEYICADNSYYRASDGLWIVHMKLS